MCLKYKHIKDLYQSEIGKDIMELLLRPRIILDRILKLLNTVLLFKCQ